MLRIDRSKISRREALGALGATGLAFVGCGSFQTAPTGTTTGSSGGSSGTGTSGTSSCAVIPEETAGPYPDRIGMITNSAYYRRDVTEGKSGLPLALALSVVNVKNSCAA